MLPSCIHQWTTDHSPTVQASDEIYHSERGFISSPTIHPIGGDNEKLRQPIFQPRWRQDKTEAAARRPLRWPPGSRERYLQEATAPAPSVGPTSSLLNIWQLHSAETLDSGRLRSHQRLTLGEAPGGKHARPCSPWSKRLLFLPQQQGVLNFSMSVSPQVSWRFCPTELSPRVHSCTRSLLRGRKTSGDPVSEPTASNDHSIQNGWLNTNPGNKIWEVSQTSKNSLYFIYLVGNYCLEGSSPPNNCHSSSPFGQLPSGRFIPYWVAASLSVFRGGKPPLENHNTYLWFQRLIINWAIASGRLIPNWAIACPTPQLRGPLTRNLMLVRSKKENPRSRMTSPILASRLLLAPWLKSSLHSEISAYWPSLTPSLKSSLHSGISASQPSSTPRLKSSLHSCTLGDDIIRRR